MAQYIITYRIAFSLNHYLLRCSRYNLLFNPKILKSSISHLLGESWIGKGLFKTYFRRNNCIFYIWLLQPGSTKSPAECCYCTLVWLSNPTLQVRKAELAALIQATFRGWRQWRIYQEMRAAVTIISKHWKRVLAQRLKEKRRKAAQDIRK